MTNRILEMVDRGEHKLEELSIELTNACGTRCVHCSSGSQPNAAANELTREEHFDLMRQARQLGATVLSLSGGDPIVVPDVDEYVDMALELGYEQVLFYTTGIWCSDSDYIDGKSDDIEVPCVAYNADDRGVCGIRFHPLLRTFERLGQDGRLVFVFSLHSHVASVNDCIMNMPGAWHSITRDIEYLRDAGVTVWVHMVPTRLNITHVVQMRDLCADLGVKKLNLLRFVPQTRGYVHREQLLPSVEAFYDFQKMLDKEMNKTDHPVALRAGCPADFRHAVGSLPVFEKAKMCHATCDAVLCRPDGTVHPCAAWKSLPHTANVRDKSLADIWENDPMFNAVRKFLHEGWKSLEGFCSDCEYLWSCRGGCPAQRLHAYGKKIEDIYVPKPDPLCPRLYEVKCEPES